MKYKISLSKIFHQHLDQVDEMDTALNYKRIAQSLKSTARNLEKMEKSGVIIETTRIKSKVPNTPYSVVYKVVTNPHKKLIAKRIIKHK